MKTGKKLEGLNKQFLIAFHNGDSKKVEKIQNQILDIIHEPFNLPGNTKKGKRAQVSSN